jgi:hypothetical protein
MPSIKYPVRSSTYQQHKNDLEESWAVAEFQRRKEEMQLDESPLFSKNQIDVAVARAIAKQMGWVLLSFIIGMAVAYLIGKL